MGNGVKESTHFGELDCARKSWMVRGEQKPSTYQYKQREQDEAPPTLISHVLMEYNVARPYKYSIQTSDIRNNETYL